jgi:hypothetical protein
VLVFVLAAFCWTKSLLCNVAAFTGILLYLESTLQLCSLRRFYEVFKEVYFGSLSVVRTTWYSVRMLISQQHPSERRGVPSRSSSVSNIRLDDVSSRPDAHLSIVPKPSGRRAISSERPTDQASSVRTKWVFARTHHCIEKLLF